MSYRDVPTSTEQCPSCEEQAPSGSEVCPHCGNPIDIARLAELELKLKPDLRKARTFLGVLTLLNVVALLIGLAGGHSPVAQGMSVLLFGICFLVAKKRPLGASVAAMALFLFSEGAALGARNMGALFGGLILKVIFVVLIVAGIRSGYRVRDLRGQWRKRDWVIGMVVLATSALAGLLFGLSRS